ncbi:hypothetical protein [Planktotalea sp.]|uniref:DUF6902 family protein n=1 Tax=Planktotalea sp. TaxID=2029877 RepID=UPI003298C397
MSANVISLSQHFKPKTSSTTNFLNCFAHHRKDQNDVFWLKENAEILNIFECCGLGQKAQIVECYQPFYHSLSDRISFFPQYYRFLTSIALDLEALGMEGSIAEQLCQFVAKQGVHDLELSDLQRAEAMRLLARRNIPVQDADALVARLHAFMDQSAHFALPNRKTAYELTHIVFYLSEYGRRDPNLSTAAIQSLMFTGILAHLDENADLLSEICIALRYAGQTPPEQWEELINQRIDLFTIEPCSAVEGSDQYHEYFVANWARAESGKVSFSAPVGEGAQLFSRPEFSVRAMRALSQVLFERPDFRNASWGANESNLMELLPNEIGAHLRSVASATSEFEAFFELFARPDVPGLASHDHKNLDRKGAAF